MYVEICGTDRCNYCFAVCCSLGTCSVQRSCPCHKPSMLVSDPLPFCQTVLSAPFLCWSEPASSEVMWLCVLSAVCGAILEFPHDLQALSTLSSAALQHLLITACLVCHMWPCWQAPWTGAAACACWQHDLYGYLLSPRCVATKVLGPQVMMRGGA